MKDLEDSGLSQTLLSKIYDKTGTQNGGNKGFYMFFINGSGDPCCVYKFENNAVRMALQKAIETTIEDNAADFEIGDLELDFDLDD